MTSDIEVTVRMSVDQAKALRKLLNGISSSDHPMTLTEEEHAELMTLLVTVGTMYIGREH